MDLTSRVLLNKIQDELSSQLSEYIFEPINTNTLDRIEHTTKMFLNQMVDINAIYDYTIMCDERNNKCESIINVDIAIKHSPTYEFIYIPMTISSEGVDSNTENYNRAMEIV